MEWVNRLADRKEEESRRKNTLRDGAGRMYASLLAAVEASVYTFNERKVRPNNEQARYDAQARAVNWGTVDPATNAFTVTPNSESIAITLRGATTITTVPSNAEQRWEVFVVELDDNGYPTLKYEADVITLDRAAEITLAQFLFGAPPN